MTASPTVSVVIPSYRRLANLPSLIECHVLQGADEIVVVLDGPHQGWRTELASAAALEPVRVVELAENRGLALARIAGLEAARGDVVVMTDDDVIPGPGFIARHRAFHGRYRDHVLLGYMPVELPERRGADEAPTYLYARDYEKQADHWRDGDSAVILGSLWGGNVSLPRDLYVRAERLKPSERLEYNEDLDLGLRLIEAGASAMFDEEAKAAHHHRRQFEGFKNECVVRGAAIHDLERRWGRIPDQLLPLIVVPSDYSRYARWVQEAIGERDRPGLIEHGLGLAYRTFGILRLWPLQDAVARLLRRGLAIRGYRKRARLAAG